MDKDKWLDPNGPAQMATTLQPIVEVAKARGVDIDAVCRVHGIDPSVFASVETRVAFDRLTPLLAELERMGEGDPLPLGLRAAERAHEAAQPLFDYLLQTTRCLREAAVIGTFRVPLLDEVCTRGLVEDGTMARFSIVPSDVTIPIAPLLYEYALGRVALMSWALMGRERIGSEVRFSRPAPADPRPYEEFFKTKVVFGAERDEIVFFRVYLDLPLPQHQSEARDAPSERPLLAAAPTNTSIVDRVRQAANAGLDRGDASLASVAKRLQTSCRTLQRRLREKGTSFEAVLEAVRRDLAVQGVVADDMPIVVISNRLGFSDSSAFARAFRRWTGMSPSEYRVAART